MSNKFILFYIFFLNAIYLNANTFFVTKTADSGNGTLRQALIDANDKVGADTIQFNIPHSDSNFNGAVWEIRPASALPTLKDAGTMIDGFSQWQRQGDTNPDGPEIVLNGIDAGDVNGLTIESGQNRLSGLVLGQFKHSGIQISTRTSSRNIISGCYIGLDYAGATAFSNGWYGIYIKDASRNIIGGSDAADQNLISGNLQHGVYLVSSSYNQILGNYIGTNKTGMTAIGNGYGGRGRTSFAGVYIQMGRGNRIGGSQENQRNLLSGNGKAGIIIIGANADSNLVQGNFIGLAANGVDICSNGEAGIQLRDYCAYNVIGGYNLGDGNVVSGNESSGIQLRGNGVRGNVVAGNRIGTDMTGSIAIGNSHNGIYLFNDTARLTVAGPQQNRIGPGNMICGTWHKGVEEWAGIRIDYAKTDSNLIFENFIGQNKDGSLADGFAQGIRIGNGAQFNIVGPNNVIGNHSEHGIKILGSSTRGNSITQNYIFKNPKSIGLYGGSNDNIEAPFIIAASSYYVTGQTLANGIVEIYSGQVPGEIESLQAIIRADSNGIYRWEGHLQYQYVDVLVTDGIGNTSELTSLLAVPVELVSFQAVPTDGLVQVSWSTANESNNFGFELQISDDGINFHKVIFIPGHGTTSAFHDYHYSIRPVGTGKKYFRLKQIDLDGAVIFSQVIEVDFSMIKSFTLAPCYPNPFSPSGLKSSSANDATLSYQIPQESTVKIVIYDVRGRKVRQMLEERREAGSHTIAWDGYDDAGQIVASGVYLARVQASGWQSVVKITIVK